MNTTINLCLALVTIIISTSIYLFALRSIRKNKTTHLPLVSSIKVEYFNNLVVEDYDSFEKYQIWRYIVYKEGYPRI